MMVRARGGASDGKSVSASTLDLELANDPYAPAVARGAALEHCERCALSPSQCHTIVLLVSEVVSNAVLHSRARSGSSIMLTAEIGRGRIRVSVLDGGAGFTPRPREPGVTQGGYGLYLVDKASSRWGVDRVEDGTRVWFELPLIAA
jgi:anti-sigma regulatory factor (Ser/Thr protein kinase)